MTSIMQAPMDMVISSSSDVDDSTHTRTSTSSLSSSFSFATLAEPSERVRFSAEITYIPTLNRSDFTGKEMQDCFYSEKEKKQQYAAQNKAIHRCEQGKPERDDQLHRGLEPLTKKGFRLLCAAKNKCVDAVMDEQEEQWRSGLSSTKASSSASLNWDRLALASMQISKASTVIAYKMAKRDAQQANKAYKQMQREEEKMEEDAADAADTADTADTLSVASSLTDERSTRSTGLQMSIKTKNTATTDKPSNNTKRTTARSAIPTLTAELMRAE